MDLACLRVPKASQGRWFFGYVSVDPANPRKVGEPIS